MRAAVLTQLNAPLEVADVEPTNLQFGQVLVKVLLSGICGAQLQEIRGDKGNGKFIPHLLGHEGCGYVEKIGEGVTRLKKGDKVVMHWRKASGIESPFPQYLYGDRPIQSGKVTTFSQYSICSENRLTPVPEGTPDTLCALLGCGLSTALATIETEAAMKMGQSLLIIGCGGLGLNLIRAARMRNICPIVVCDIKGDKKKSAIESGATEFVWLTSPHCEWVRKFDVIIDTAGDMVAMSSALLSLAPSGQYIMLGQPRPGVGLEMLNAVHMFEGKGKTIKATQGGGFQPDEDIPRYVKLFQDGRLNISGIITDTVSLADVNRGIELVKNGKAGRVMISPWG